MINRCYNLVLVNLIYVNQVINEHGNSIRLEKANVLTTAFDYISSCLL